MTRPSTEAQIADEKRLLAEVSARFTRDCTPLGGKEASKKFPAALKHQHLDALLFDRLSELLAEAVEEDKKASKED